MTRLIPFFGIIVNHAYKPEQGILPNRVWPFLAETTKVLNGPNGRGPIERLGE
jgi:hypothetical protein